jgi:rhamnose transport system ATP-binding protein
MKLELSKISKFFPGVKALHNINFNLKKNSIHALIGENGAGKSTLVKILCGVYQPDEGIINIDSQKVQIADPNQSLKYGISAIHQESVMFDELTVMENIFIGNHLLKKNKLIDWNTMIAKSKKILSQLETDITSNDKIKDLSIAQRHIVQIARSLAQDADIVIMDEPTAALSQKEIEELYKIIKNLQKQDKSIIFISHKLDEILEVCDEYTVRREGQVVSTDKMSNTKTNQLSSALGG